MAALSAEGVDNQRLMKNPSIVLPPPFVKPFFSRIVQENS